jgi:hypothetical protein
MQQLLLSTGFANKHISILIRGYNTEKWCILCGPYQLKAGQVLGWKSVSRELLWLMYREIQEPGGGGGTSAIGSQYQKTGKDYE